MTDDNDPAPEVSIDELDCIGDTLRQRLKNEGIETRSDFKNFTRRVPGVWFDYISGIGTERAREIKNEFDKLKFNNE